MRWLDRLLGRTPPPVVQSIPRRAEIIGKGGREVLLRSRIGLPPKPRERIVIRAVFRHGLKVGGGTLRRHGIIAPPKNTFLQNVANEAHAIGVEGIRLIEGAGRIARTRLRQPRKGP